VFLRILKYSLKNILRNKFLSISSVLVLGLLIFFINILVVLHNVSLNLISEINSKMTISLYLKDDYNQNSLGVIEFQKDLEAIAPGKIIATVNSKEDVLADLEKRDPQLVEILERDNPLPATITIE
jgi:cell division transport system permease protein